MNDRYNLTLKTHKIDNRSRLTLDLYGSSDMLQYVKGEVQKLMDRLDSTSVSDALKALEKPVDKEVGRIVLSPPSSIKGSKESIHGAVKAVADMKDKGNNKSPVVKLDAKKKDNSKKKQ